MHTVDTYDSVLGSSGPQTFNTTFARTEVWSQTFYTIDDTGDNPLKYALVLSWTDKAIAHTRKAYTLLDMLSDVGGIIVPFKTFFMLLV